MTFRETARRILPPRVRRLLRTVQIEAPVRLRDLITAIRRQDRQPVPGASLRLRVARSSSREDFLRVGLALADAVLGAARTAGLSVSGTTILDFGCGSGRVARHVIDALPTATLFGVDVDGQAIDWCSRNLEGRFSRIFAAPPAPFPDRFFDWIYAVSVFTHLDIPDQDRWLAEMKRLLKPGGVFIASTHHPVLTFERPDLSESQHRILAEKGFLFAPGGGSPNEDSSFHSPDYLRSHWSRWLEGVAYKQHGLAAYQDLSVWRPRNPETFCGTFGSPEEEP